MPNFLKSEIRLKVVILLPMVLMSIVGIIVIFNLMYIACQSFISAQASYQTMLEDIVIRHSKVDNVDLDSIITLLSADFIEKYEDTIFTMMNENRSIPPDIRIFIQFKPEQGTATVFYDYFFLCKTCPYFTLWRANIFIDSTIGIPILQGVVHRRITSSEYLTFKSSQGGDEN